MEARAAKSLASYAAIPDEWIDKLFNCMTMFYGERWNKVLGEPSIAAHQRKIWKNGLRGLSYDEIKAALVLCKEHGAYKMALPPNLMEFWRYAKGTEKPYLPPKK
jgi:hypothetical protein